MKISHLSNRERLGAMTRLILVIFALIGLALTPIRALATGLADASATSPTPETSPSPEATVEDISWLGHATTASELASDQSLVMLAGKLINAGMVDASTCQDGGLMKNGYASPCGERVARPVVTLWQNQFDEAILQAANQEEIPPYLLKDLIAHETQFWPARHLTIYGYYEFGLGHVTQMGADTLLRWNPDFYKSFCGQVFSADTCKTPYSWMPADQQATLRGAALQVVMADCEGCPGGIDLQRARASIPVIAAVVKANLNHLEWLLRGFTSSTPNKAFENSDLWRLTVASYNAGPGCITTAASSAVAQHLKLNWKNISAQFDDGCQGAIGYVDQVSAFYPASPEALESAQLDRSNAAVLVYAGLGMSFPTPTPEATATPNPTTTESPTAGVASDTPEPGPVSPTPGGVTATPGTETASLTPGGPTATPGTETASPTPGGPTNTPGTETASPTGGVQSGTPGTPNATPEPATGSPTPAGTSQPTATVAPTAAPTAVPDEAVVKFKALVPQIIANAVIQASGGENSEQIDALGLTVVKAPADKMPGVLDALKNNLFVSYAEPNYGGQVLYTPNDPGFAGQSSLLDLHVPQAWDLNRGEGVLVAVIDTGVDATHPDLAGNLWVNPGETGLDASGNDKRSNGIDDDNDGYVDDWQGWNFVNNSNDINDLNGHGTHSAGIIAARMDNNLGIAGVAPLAKIMPLKAVDDKGYGTYADVAKAITYAVDHGAKVINVGFGGVDKSAVLQAATDYAYSHGVIVVAAAGNSGTNGVFYPAADSNVIAVSALDSSLKLASFSSYGSEISLAAPGVGIYSTYPGGNYVQLSGTSMAAAQVSGIVALLVSQGRLTTPDQVRAALFGTALDLSDPGVDIQTGHGLPQAFEALNYTGPLPTSTVTPTATLGPTPTADTGGGTILADYAGTSISNYALSCSTTTYNTALNGTAPGTTINIDNAYTNINLPFDYWYMGTRYQAVYVSSNGWLSFANPGNNYSTNSLTNTTPGRPFIAPLWDDLNGSNGNFTYATAGTAPNRTFTMEWWNWSWDRSTTNAVISFKVILYEATGQIQFVYHQNGSAVTNNSGGASIGLSASNTGSGNFLSLQNTSNPCGVNGTSTTNETTNLSNKPAEGTVWTFTPRQANAPTAPYLTNIVTTGTTVTLNWTDNSTNELGFQIYRSTDGTAWTLVTTVPAGSTSYNATGLTAGVDYYWRIYALTETVSSMAVVTPPTNMTFSNITLNSMTVGWTDTATTETGYLVYRSTDGVNYTLMTTLPASSTSYNALSLTSGTTYYWKVMAAGTTVISQGLNGLASTPTMVTQPPTVSILSPASGSSFVEGRTITFRGSATIPTNADISSKLVWTMDGGTVIGSGASFTLNNLKPGAHAITATVTDDYGRTASATINVTITANPSPHSGFNGSTEQCAICHRSHSAVQQTPYLINTTLSPNDMCLSCHSNDAVVVSTHSNVDWVAAGYPNPRTEGAFELQCIQCHNPHGLDQGSSNLNNVRKNVWLTTAISASSYPDGLDVHQTTGPVVFTAKSGANSYDDGTAGTANKICVTCHANTANPGYPMINHTGGAAHGNGTISYVGLDCTQCHPHSLDSNPTTRDGFQTSCRACHSQQLSRTSSPGTRRQIVSNPISGPNGGDFKRASHHINDNLTDADCLVCHEMSQHKLGRVRLKNADTGVVYQLDYTFLPSTPTQTDADNYKAFCASCHDSNGANGNQTPFSDGKIAPSVTGLWGTARHNGTFGTFLGSCLSCHDNGHGSNKLKLLAPYNFVASTAPDAMQQEEKFCFGCHTTSPGRPVAAAFNNYTNTTTAFFKHDVSVDKGLDHGKEVFPSAFGGSNRHIECGDCHEPHEDAYPNTATAPAVKSSQRGGTGVEPTYNGTGAPTVFSFISQVANEYQTCFKCHSSYTSLPTYIPDGWGCTTNNCAARTQVPDGLRKLTRTANGQTGDTRDLAKAFNLNNASFHPLLAVGKNTTMVAASFVNGWGVNSRVYCSDCHTNATPATNGVGPHGSPLLHILDGSSAGDTNYSTLSQTSMNGEPLVPNTEICFKCHDYNTYVGNSSAANTHFRNGGATGNNLHYGHMNNGYTRTTCYTCHNSHGGNNAHLVNFDASVAVPNAGRTSETAWVWNGTSGSCYLSCHGGTHNPFTYTP